MSKNKRSKTLPQGHAVRRFVLLLIILCPTILAQAQGSPGHRPIPGASADFDPAGSANPSALDVPLTIQEAIYSGISGRTRVQDPVTVGIPLADSEETRSISQLGLRGASVGQFRILGRWPSGNIKWLLVDTQVDVAASKKNTSVSLMAGNGNFVGSDLATEDSATITINTGPAVFTIKKANFNLIDRAVVNGKTLIASGTDLGLVILGPVPNSTTCPCSTIYSSAYDPNSSAVIEESGPVRAVIRATGQHKDPQGNAYMRYTVRLSFYKNRSYIKVLSQLQNADYGESGSFASAYKGFASYEVRLPTTLGDRHSFSFGTHGSSVNGSFAAKEDAYLYQAYSNDMEDCGWNASDKRPQYALRSYIARTQVTNASCASVWKYAQEGYQVVHGGKIEASGTRSQHPEGWADLTDSTGAGIEFGIYDMSAYWPKSLQFMSGGDEARIGIWPDQSLFLSGGGQQYFQSWPQYSAHTLFINFHSSALSSPADEFLKFQYNLMARAPLAQYATSGVLPFALIDPREEDEYYKSLKMPCCIKDNDSPHIYHFYAWTTGGGFNQAEMRWADLMLWLQRGFVGRYLNSANFYRFQTEQVFPRSDYNGNSTFHWRDPSIPPSKLDRSDFPTITSVNNNIGCDPGTTQCGRNWIDDQHAHWYGMIDYYFLSGDESIKDAIESGVSDKFGNPNIQLVQKGLYWVARNIGEALMSDARLSLFYSAIGDSASAGNAFAAGDLILQNQVWPDLQLSGFGSAAQGVSRTRGVQWGCCGKPREAKPFQLGILNEGLWEYLQAHGTSWPEYQNTFDLAYGIADFSLTEAWRNSPLINNCNGGEGMTYEIKLDSPNNPLTAACNATIWFNFFVAAKYTGDSNSWDGWKAKFLQQLKRTAVTNADYGLIFIGTMIHEVLHPEPMKLVDVPVTSAAGAKTLSWTVPAGVVSYRLKYSDRNIVNWLNFDPATNTFGLDPETNVPWFAATSLGSPPVTGDTTQNFAVPELDNSKDWKFHLKAVVK